MCVLANFALTHLGSWKKLSVQEELWLVMTQLCSDIASVLQYVSAGFQVVPGLKIQSIKASAMGCNHVLFCSLCSYC